MRYGCGVRLDMESLLPRGIKAPERRSVRIRTGKAKRPILQADTCRVGRSKFDGCGRTEYAAAGRRAVLVGAHLAHGLEQCGGEKLATVGLRAELRRVLDAVG